MQLAYLTDHPEFLPILANWYFEEWGYLDKDRTLDTEIENLRNYLNKKHLPLVLLAIEEHELLGAAQLKYHEMSIYTDKEHWLGGVYVAEKHRGQGIARQIIEALIEMAADLDIKKLYLQTEKLDGGLYRRLGWEPLEQVNYRKVDVLVMEKNIKNEE